MHEGEGSEVKRYYREYLFVFPRRRLTGIMADKNTLAYFKIVITFFKADNYVPSAGKGKGNIGHI